MTDTEVVTVTVQIMGETPLAYRVSETGDDEDAVWLPKSLVELGTKVGPATYEMDMPEWLAVREGLA